MHIKSVVDWSLCKRAKLDLPQKGEFCWYRGLQARDTQPANKPIVRCFFRMAITGNTNGFNYQTWHLLRKKKWQFLTGCTHRQNERERDWERANDWLVLPQWQTHVLLHLLQAVVVCVDEVKGQRSCQRAASSSWRDPQKPADMSDVLIVLNWARLNTMLRKY